VIDDVLLVGMMTGFAPTVAVIVGSYITYRQGASTHKIVNSQRTEMLAQIDGMRDEITRLNVVIEAVRGAAATARIDDLQK